MILQLTKINHTRKKVLRRDVIEAMFALELRNDSSAANDKNTNVCLFQFYPAVQVIQNSIIRTGFSSDQPFRVKRRDFYTFPRQAVTFHWMRSYYVLSFTHPAVDRKYRHHSPFLLQVDIMGEVSRRLSATKLHPMCIWTNTNPEITARQVLYFSIPSFCAVDRPAVRFLFHIGQSSNPECGSNIYARQIYRIPSPANHWVLYDSSITAATVPRLQHFHPNVTAASIFGSNLQFSRGLQHVLRFTTLCRHTKKKTVTADSLSRIRRRPWLQWLFTAPTNLQRHLRSLLLCYTGLIQSPGRLRSRRKVIKRPANILESLNQRYCSNIVPNSSYQVESTTSAKIFGNFST
ncbi:hypothetical protein C8Q75DRAFT_329624 [Abortiporus biennis]|nr:hypothetical protein C8Q75DRAFT_329624 [Abortiporus biennis]